jgi:DNA polymerase III epsilon subunit-like protein
MILLLDTETTGLLKPGNDWMVQPGIVQIGAIKIVDLKDNFYEDGFPGQEIGHLNSLINPEVPFAWDEKAIETHGITPELVKNSPTLFEFFDHLAELACGCDTWAGYNTHFDKEVLRFQLERYGFATSFPWPRHEIDVMKLAERHMAMQGKRGTKSPKLEEIYNFLFPTKTFQAHDALADIRATAEVMKELMK